MKKKVLSTLLCVTMAATMFAGCGSNTTTNNSATTDDAAATNDVTTGTEEAAAPSGSGETISLRVWAAEEDQTLTNELIEQFKAANPDQTFDITVGVESEANAKDDILVDPEAAADVFAFANDQIVDLVNANVLQPVQDTETVSSQNVEGAVQAATVNDTLYAYPFSADNGYLRAISEYRPDKLGCDPCGLCGCRKEGRYGICFGLVQCKFLLRGQALPHSLTQTEARRWTGTELPQTESKELTLHRQCLT